MALKQIELDGQPILVEVTDLDIEAGGDGRWEKTSRASLEGADGQDMGERISGLVAVLTAPVRRSLALAGAAEWTMEITLGFKGETGVPFVAKGEANAAVKVTATWSKPAARERAWLTRARRR
jgi:hypothetical protein